ncbi:hypothetical protein ABE437_13460 [Isoptericola cucumis]|uniref:hypothetical protein n=1 Tax=Isoptericola cucumis TaxID=1776856 RepID=UPI00320A2EAB
MRPLLMTVALGLYVLAGFALLTAAGSWLGHDSTPGWTVGCALGGLLAGTAYSVQRTSRHYRGV